MRTAFQRLSLLLALALLARPLAAQLDPRLQGTVNGSNQVTTPVKNDFLDLFTANTQSVKPDVLSILDFSGSMHSMMWHPSYWTANNEDTHMPSGWTAGDDVFFVPYISSYDNATFQPKIRFVVTDGNANTYGFNNQLNLNQVDGILIKGDGTPVTASDVGSLTGNVNAKLAAWISAATHVRITGTNPNDGTTRTLDLPIPWQIPDSTPYVDQTYASYSTQWAPDPQNGNNPTYFDTINLPLGSVPGTNYDADYDLTSVTGYGRVGIPWYNRDYMFWLFFGKDVVNSTYTDKVDNQGTYGGYVVPSVTDVNPAGKTCVGFYNGIPTLARFQGVKRAVISTWLANQTKVYWGYRFLDPSEQYKTTVDPFNSGGGSGNSNHNLTLFSVANGNNADPSVSQIQSKIPRAGTPLNYALANAYAQINTTPNQSIFSSAHASSTGGYTPPSCQAVYVIVFTDGIANDHTPNGATGGVPGTGNPYGTSNNDSASLGNKAVIAAGLTSLDPGQVNFNLYTLAGVAAHGNDANLKPNYIAAPATYPTSSAQELALFAPFAVQQSKGANGQTVTFKPPRPVNTMTVGVSLPGSYLDVTSPKFELLAAATYGNPTVTEWDITQSTPYNAGDPNSTYFFDARDPQSLVNNLIAAIAATQQPVSRTVGNVVTPLVGLTLGSQIYLGSFKPPPSPSSVWGGDLRMYATKSTATGLTILAKDGMTNANTLPNDVDDPDAPQWSAKNDIFNTVNGGQLWSSRTIYTRLPATSTNKTPGLVKFTDQSPDYDVIASSIDTVHPDASDTAKKAVINFLRGQDAKFPTRNRSNVMGDVINCNPVSLEFPLSMVPAVLATKAGTGLNVAGARFRVVFVGSNQGFLHAFGEVSWPAIAGDRSIYTTGVAVELWAFLPTDFLANLNYLATPTNTHRYTMDGALNTYFVDKPTSANLSGNGLVDSDEPALVIFGLRKGGRSWYALTFTNGDPMKPQMAWSLRADEADAVGYPAAVKYMGYSYGFPSMGTVFTGPDSTPSLNDVLFLGGGYSVPEVEANFKDAVNTNGYLGRSVIALNLANRQNDGSVTLQIGQPQIVKFWDFGPSGLNIAGAPGAGMGPVSAGVVPFEFFLNSGRKQRAYFSDHWGGVWALGSGRTTTLAEDPSNTFVGFRRDSSNLSDWTSTGTSAGGTYYRKIFQSAAGQRISTRLSPFIVSPYPATNAKGVNPMTVGIPFVTGDRNDPTDQNTPVPSTGFNQFTMVFDRQDINTTLLGNSNLAPLGTVLSSADSRLNPADATNFYLKNYYGYFLPFPGAVSNPTPPPANLYPKGVQSPLVLNGTLYFSYFNPSGYEPCGGGAGTTFSFRECRALFPVFKNGDTTQVDASTFSTTDACNGMVFSWVSISTEWASQGTSRGLQSGNVPGAAAGTGGTNQAESLGIKGVTGSPSERFPRPRTWRTVPVHN